MIDDDPRLDPGEIRRHRFPGNSRRYEARAVDEFVDAVAERVVATNALVDRLLRRVEMAEQAAAEARSAPPPDRPELSLLDDDELVRLVGEETTSVLATARRAAEEIRSKSEDSAARVIREATTEANVLIEGAEARVAELTAQAQSAYDRAAELAEKETTQVRRDAEHQAQRIIAEAHERARAEIESIDGRKEAAEAEAARILVEAREEGRKMIAEAKEVRARVLDDLQRRRDAARTQIDALLVGRDRLLVALDAVRDHVDEVTGQLQAAVPDSTFAPPMDRPETDRPVGEEPDLAEAAVEREDRPVTPPVVEDDTVAPAAALEDTATTLAEDVVVDVTADVVTVDAVVVEDDVVEDDVVDAVVVEDVVVTDVVVTDDVVDVTVADEVAVEDTPDEAATGATVEDGDTTEVVGHGSTAAEEAPAAVDALFARLRAEREEASARDDAGLLTRLREEREDAAAQENDALFARLRAEREESVARAREVLAEPPEVEAEAEGVEDGVGAVALLVESEPTDEVEVSTDADLSTDVDVIPPGFLAPDDLLERRQASLAELGPSLAKALKRQLADEQNDALDRLRRVTRAQLSDLYADETVHVADYARVARPALAAAAAAGAATVPGGEGTVVDVAPLAWTLGATLVEPFRRRVERAIDEVDGDPDELDERLRALYREWKTGPIEVSADDALLSAYAQGTYEAAPEDADLLWRIDPAQGPCPDAQDNALAGPVRKGDEFPTGDRCPQAHPGCLCLLSCTGSAEEAG